MSSKPVGLVIAVRMPAVVIDADRIVLANILVLTDRQIQALRTAYSITMSSYAAR